MEKGTYRSLIHIYMELVGNNEIIYKPKRGIVFFSQNFCF